MATKPSGFMMSRCECCMKSMPDWKLLQLPCQDSFCITCLEKYVPGVFDPNQRVCKFSCCLCGQKASVRREDIETVRCQSKLGDIHLPPSTCDICGPGAASTNKCVQCEQNFCEKCSQVHRRMTASRNHDLEEVKSSAKEYGTINEADDIPKQAEDIRNEKSKETKKCQDHPTEEVKMYCNKCNEFLCLICKLTDHENHYSQDVSAKAADVRKKLKDVEHGEPLKNYFHNVMSNIEILSTIDDDLQRSKQKEVAELRDSEKEVQNHISNVAKQREDELRQKYNGRIGKMSNELEHQKEELRKFSALAKKAQEVHDHASDLQIYEDGEELCKALEIESSKTGGSGRREFKMLFQKGETDTKALDRLIGEVVDGLPLQKLPRK